jgi:hypothetical protein
LVLVVAPSFGFAFQPQNEVRTQKNLEKRSKLLERALGIPTGSPVAVRLQSNEKLWGRIGEVSNEGFGLQTVKDAKIENRKISFNELESIKIAPKTSKLRSMTKAALGVMSVLTLAGTLANLTRD